MTRKFSLSLLGIILISVWGCRKVNYLTDNKTELTVLEAKQHFEQFLENHKSSDIQAPIGTPTTIRQPLPRTPKWAEAKLIDISLGKAVTVPLEFENPLSVKLDEGLNISLNDITTLLIYTDRSGKEQIDVLTSIPIKEYVRSTNPNKAWSGKIIVTDWEGNFLDGYEYRQTGLSILEYLNINISNDKGLPTRDNDRWSRRGHPAAHRNEGSGGGEWYEDKKHYYDCTEDGQVFMNETCRYSHTETTYSYQYHHGEDKQGEDPSAYNYANENDYYASGSGKGSNPGSNPHSNGNYDYQNMPEDGDYEKEAIKRFNDQIDPTNLPPCLKRIFDAIQSSNPNNSPGSMGNILNELNKINEYKGNISFTWSLNTGRGEVGTVADTYLQGDYSVTTRFNTENPEFAGMSDIGWSINIMHEGCHAYLYKYITDNGITSANTRQSFPDLFITYITNKKDNERGQHITMAKQFIGTMARGLYDYTQKVHQGKNISYDFCYAMAWAGLTGSEKQPAMQQFFKDTVTDEKRRKEIISIIEKEFYTAKNDFSGARVGYLADCQ